MLESIPQTRMLEGLDDDTEAHALEACPGEEVGAVFGSRDRSHGGVHLCYQGVITSVREQDATSRSWPGCAVGSGRSGSRD